VPTFVPDELRRRPGTFSAFKTGSGSDFNGLIPSPAFDP
jgi:hypothetical protein